LVHHASIDCTDNSGATPLWIACKRGHEAVAQLLARGLGVVHHSDLDSPTRLNQMHPRANADR
jgi:ankyrin repeat protein